MKKGKTTKVVEIPTMRLWNMQIFWKLRKTVVAKSGGLNRWNMGFLGSETILHETVMVATGHLYIYQNP